MKYCWFSVSISAFDPDEFVSANFKDHFLLVESRHV